MPHPARIPDLVMRERFIRTSIATGTLYFVAGDRGWATVPFRHDPSREVVLFWSSRHEAGRWAEVVAVTPTVHDVRLEQLLQDVLPMLAQYRCLIGYDWSTDPADPVIAPDDLAERIWRERTDALLAAIRESDTIWLLESAGGPALLPSLRRTGSDCLPAWSTREAAAAQASGAWTGKRPLAVPLPTFRERYLPFLEDRGASIGLEPMRDAGMRELTPSEFATLAYPRQMLQRFRAV